MLPWGTPVPADTSWVVVRFVPDRSGFLAEAYVVRVLGAAVDAAVLTARHQRPAAAPKAATCQ